MDFYSCNQNIQTPDHFQIIEEPLRRAQIKAHENLGQILNTHASGYQYASNKTPQFSLDESDSEQELPVMTEPHIEILPSDENSMETTLTLEAMDTSSESHQFHHMEEEEIDRILGIKPQQPYQNVSNPYMQQYQLLNPRKKTKGKNLYCQCHSRCRETMSCNCTRRGVPCGSDCFCKCPNRECLKQRKRISWISSQEQHIIEGFSLECTFQPFFYPEP